MYEYPKNHSRPSPSPNPFRLTNMLSGSVGFIVPLPLTRLLLGEVQLLK